MECQNQQLQINNKREYKVHFFSNNKYCVFLHYMEGHLVNLKQKFPLGHMRIFDDTKMYYRELVSTTHLNSRVEWDNNFFQMLIREFGKFQIKKRNDVDDQTLDFIVMTNGDKKQYQILLQASLEEDFGSDSQKEFWKEFEYYNNSKNQEIAENQEIKRKFIITKEKKLEGIKNYYEESEKEKKALIGRLSAILAEKVNKLREFEEDYNIELFEDKFRKHQQEQEQQVLSTYQEDMQMVGTLFQPSQNFR